MNNTQYTKYLFDKVRDISKANPGVINNTNAVAVIIHAVSPVSNVASSAKTSGTLKSVAIKPKIMYLIALFKITPLFESLNYCIKKSYCNKR